MRNGEPSFRAVRNVLLPLKTRVARLLGAGYYPHALQKSQKFVEHFLSGYKRCLSKRPNHAESFAIPLVLAVGDRDPVHGISEYPPHRADGRFGVP